MKKYIALTSLLALVACGGGGGGGGGGAPAGGGVTVSGASNVRSAFLTGAPSNANTELTSMTSAIVVSDDGSEPAAYRSAARHYNDKDYTVFDLSDVNFRIAENPTAGHFKFTVDDHGTITEIDETLEGGTVAGVQRIGTTQRFNTPIFEYVKDKYAKVGDAVFTMGNSDAAVEAKMKQVLENRYGLSGGSWVLESDDTVWRYKNSDENYASFGQTTMISNNTGAMEMAIEDAYNFGEGAWVVVGENLQYQVYGDKALKRVADTGQNMDALNAAAPNELGHWNRVDEILDISTEGEAVGLTFSDFGKFNPVYRSKHKGVDASMLAAIRSDAAANLDVALDENANASTIDSLATIATMRVGASAHDYKTAAEREEEFANSQDFQLFAGGYAIKDGALVDSLVPDNDTSYTGKAIGRVYASIQSNGVERAGYLATWNVPYDKDTNYDSVPDAYTDDAGHDMAKSYTTSAATMTIDNTGKQTLYMPFNAHSDTTDKFYDVTIVKDGSADPVFTFAGTPSDAQYIRNTAEANIERSFAPGYYGVETPSETAGTARYYTEQDIGIGGDAGKITREWEFQAAYGMK